MRGECGARGTADGVGKIFQLRAIKPIRCQLCQNLVAARFQPIDPYIHRRAMLKGAHFFRQARAKTALQFFFQPERIFALYPGRCWSRGGGDCRALGIAERHGPIAAGEIILRIFALSQKRGDRQRPGIVASHAVREMGVMAENRIDALGDGAAVARPGEAMAAKPGLELALQRLGGGGAENVDYGLKPGGGGHGRRL